MIQDDIIKQMESDYEIQRLKVVSISKKTRYPIIGKLFYKSAIKETLKMQEMFRSLRIVMREKYPERFI